MFNFQNWEKKFETKKQGMSESGEMIMQWGVGVYKGLQNAKKERKYIKYRISVLFLCVENFQTNFTIVIIDLKKNYYIK